MKLKNGHLEPWFSVLVIFIQLINLIYVVNVKDLFPKRPKSPAEKIDIISSLEKGGLFIVMINCLRQEA